MRKAPSILRPMRCKTERCPTVTYLPHQLRDLHAPITLCLSIPIPPLRIPKLGRSDNDFRRRYSRRGRQCLNMNMYPRIKSKDQSSIVSIKNQISTSQQDFSWSGDGYVGHVDVIPSFWEDEWHCLIEADVEDGRAASSRLPASCQQLILSVLVHEDARARKERSVPRKDGFGRLGRASALEPRLTISSLDLPCGENKPSNARKFVGIEM